MAVDATRWEDGLVILNAIRQRMDEKSSPRWIPEWARELGGDKRRARHAESMAREREALGDMDPEVRRVIAGLIRAKARGLRVSASDVTCVECRGFTDSKCPKCARALHQRACPLRHTCVALSALGSSPHSAPGEGSSGSSAVDPGESTAVRASAPLLAEAVPIPTTSDQAGAHGVGRSRAPTSPDVAP